MYTLTGGEMCYEETKAGGGMHTAASTHCGPSASSVPITMEPTIPYYEFKSFIPCFHWVATQALTQHLSK